MATRRTSLFPRPVPVVAVQATQQTKIALGAWSTITKKVTESIVSDAVLSNDAELRFAMLASTAYRIRLHAWYTVINNAAIGFQFAFTGPASPTRLRIQVSSTVSGGVTPAELAQVATYAASVTAIASAPQPGGSVHAEIFVDNVTGGTFAFQWAQNASDPDATTVLKGSYLEWAAV